MENRQDTDAYREEAMKRITDYHDRMAAFMEEHKAHFVLLQQKEDNGDYEGIRPDPQDIQASFDLLELVEANNMEDDIEVYDRWRFSMDLMRQFDALRKEGRDINRLVATLAVDHGKEMVTYFSMMLRDGLEIRAKEGADSRITMEMITTFENAVAYFQNMVMINELKLATLGDEALN